MKSIVEEASSISKAIENGWNRADKPKEFSIKILEEPEKNFWGMTVKKAKIAFFYQNKNETVHTNNSTRQRDTRDNNKISKNTSELIGNEKNNNPKTRKNEDSNKSDVLTPKKRETTTIPPSAETTAEKGPDIWTQEMIELVNEWIQQLLVWMNASHISFVCEPAGTRLKVTFNKTFLADQTQEKQLFVNAAHLAVEMIRNRLKKHIRNLHIQFFIAR